MNRDDQGAGFTPPQDRIKESSPSTRPVRVQRKREKGWRMPANTVYVGRPTKWGNPFSHTERFYGLDEALLLYRDMVRCIWNPARVEHHANWRIAYEDFLAWRKRIGGHPSELAVLELRGKNLACWCALNQPCHADVLLEIANR